MDTGTTNSRVWVIDGERVLARGRANVGVRNTAQEGSSRRLREELRDLIARALSDAGPATAAYLIAAGMITSPLGLAEIPHVPAPAGTDELASSTQRHNFSDVTSLPVLMIPGVRCGPSQCAPQDVGSCDMMRGEETLCVGLHALGYFQKGGALLSLGSHWKAIQVNMSGKVISSFTSLSGELIHSAQTQTILASSIPSGPPDSLASSWLQAGMEEQRRSGLSRALFCVRLLEQTSTSLPDERLSFMIGAFIAADLDMFLKREAIARGYPVVIAGIGPLPVAWRAALAARSIHATVVEESELENALLYGYRSVANRHFELKGVKGYEGE
ncbi:MAG TPA: 2-dehydro-3-deoxygalactonokinase [Acidobacteriota bacterium]